MKFGMDLIVSAGAHLILYSLQLSTQAMIEWLQRWKDS